MMGHCQDYYCPRPGYDRPSSQDELVLVGPGGMKWPELLYIA